MEEKSTAFLLNIGVTKDLAVSLLSRMLSIVVQGVVNGSLHLIYFHEENNIFSIFFPFFHTFYFKVLNVALYDVQLCTLVKTELFYSK